MNFPNEYYGQFPRKRHVHRAKKKKTKEHLCFQTNINLPKHKLFKNYIRSPSITLSQKISGKKFVNNGHHQMSPINTTKKKVSKANTLHSYASVNNFSNKTKGYCNQGRQKLSVQPEKQQQRCIKLSSKSKSSSQKQEHDCTFKKKKTHMLDGKKSQRKSTEISKKKNKTLKGVIADKSSKRKKLERSPKNKIIHTVISPQINIKSMMPGMKLSQNNEDEDNYQIKVLNSHCHQSQYSSVVETDTKRNRASVIGIKFDEHLKKIGKLKKYSQNLSNIQSERVEVFEREIYLCKRIYYQQLNKMGSILSGNYRSSNLFLSTVTPSKFNKYRLDCSEQVKKKLRKIKMQIKKLHQQLTSMSKQLCLKHINDPYLRMDIDNFEPELINELFEEIQQITQKIERLDDNDQGKKGQLDHRRKKSIQMIYLIAEIKGLINGEDNFQRAFQANKYKQIEQEMMKIVEKFQDMPL